MSERAGFIVATAHDDCAECERLINTAVWMCEQMGMLAAESKGGGHFANVQRDDLR